MTEISWAWGEIDPGLEGMARRLGVGVLWRDLGHRKGEYRHQARLIAVTRGLSGKQARSTLAHEIGHAVYSDDASRAPITPSQERRATVWAAGTMIDPREYARVEQLYGPHPGALAKELDVTVDLVIAWQATFGRRMATSPRRKSA